MLQENIEDMKTYIVSKDYFPLTGLRYCKRSAHSGEDFYHQKLNTWFADAYENQERISVVLDGGGKMDMVRLSWMKPLVILCMILDWRL